MKKLFKLAPVVMIGVLVVACSRDSDPPNTTSVSGTISEETGGGNVTSSTNTIEVFSDPHTYEGLTWEGESYVQLAQNGDRYEVKYFVPQSWDISSLTDNSVDNQYAASKLFTWSDGGNVITTGLPVVYSLSNAIKTFDDIENNIDLNLDSNQLTLLSVDNSERFYLSSGQYAGLEVGPLSTTSYVVWFWSHLNEDDIFFAGTFTIATGTDNSEAQANREVIEHLFKSMTITKL